MAALTRDAILTPTHRGLKQETVSMPEWGGEVIVRELTSSEADVFEVSMRAAPAANGSGNLIDDNKRFELFRAKIIVLSVIDEDGNRVFTDDDVKTLGEMPRSVLDRVASVALRLSGYSEETLKKNSSPATGSSASALH